MAKRELTPTQLNVPKSPIGGPVHHSILDGIITGIFGANTEEMTPEDAAKTEAERKKNSNEAVAMADSARRNPGAQFMNPPTSSKSGGTDILKLLGGIASIFK